MDPEKSPRFVVDSMLGRLARWLRILGFDTWYFREIEDERLLEMHVETGRVLLTRDTHLVQCRGVESHVLVTNDGWEDQLREVLETLSLSVDPARPLTRCPLCNSPLRQLSAEEAHGRVPDHVARTTTAFRGCGSCGKVYWPGTHRKRMAEVVERLCSAKA
jgi:uncharacterized protein with PIN domain